jgi:hypothetical protein
MGDHFFSIDSLVWTPSMLSVLTSLALGAKAQPIDVMVCTEVRVSSFSYTRSPTPPLTSRALDVPFLLPQAL